MSDKEEIQKRTLERMFAGARREQEQFNELQKLRKQLKSHLEVWHDYILMLHNFSFC